MGPHKAGCYTTLLFQDFCGAIERERAGFDQLFEFCGLLETPFDQSQFESDVSAMNDKMKQCEKVGRQGCQGE